MLEPSPETYQSVLSLRTVRQFRQDPVRPDDLDRILQAGRWTGSAKNRQDWTLLVLTGRDRIDQLLECGDFTTPLRTATAVIAPVRHPSGYPWDMGRVSQNMMLAAAAVGVGSCPVTLHHESCARQTLGIPDDHECGIVIALGYADTHAERTSRKASPLSGRKGLDEIVRFDSWD